MNVFSLIIISFGTLLTSTDSTLIASEPKVGIDQKADGGTRLYGKGFHPDGHLGFPCTGDRALLEDLSKVSLEHVGLGRISVADVRLKELLDFINSKIPKTSKWKLKVSDDAKEEKVTGDLDKDFINSLVSLMQKGNVYCSVTDGWVEFMKADNFVEPEPKVMHGDEEDTTPATSIIEVKPEHVLDPKADTVGGAMMYVGSYGPDETQGPGKFHYSGNVELISLVDKIELQIVGDLVVEDKLLSELAEIINGKIPAISKWKIKVGDDAKELRASGAIGKNFKNSLIRLMQDRENFYCRVTDGLVEFKKGRTPLNLVPLERASEADRREAERRAGNLPEKPEP